MCTCCPAHAVPRAGFAGTLRPNRCTQQRCVAAGEPARPRLPYPDPFPMSTTSHDYLVRATALDERVRAFALDATGVVRELQRRHDTHPAVTAALGRTAMGA